LEQKPNKALLIEEYAAANGLGQLEETKENLDAAVRYLYKILLRDLRPPWLTYAFPQALPGNVLLSRYTRPGFLHWEADQGAVLFGASVARKISKVVRAVELTLVGFLARPLYVCTAISGSEGKMCMSVASMSELIMHSEGRQHYRCKKCAGEPSLREPASGSLPLRVLHVYALVGTGGHAPTPLHMRPVRLVVVAPPPEWGWGRHRVTDALVGGESPASPEQGLDTKGVHWLYNDAESTSLWYRAGPYRGEPSDE
jgi:hypothetical protein